MERKGKKSYPDISNQINMDYFEGGEKGKKLIQNHTYCKEIKNTLKIDSYLCQNLRNIEHNKHLLNLLLFLHLAVDKN